MGSYAGTNNIIGNSYGAEYNYNTSGSANYTGDFGVNNLNGNNIISSSNYNLTNLNVVGDNNANLGHYSTVSNGNDLFSTQGVGITMTQFSEYNRTVPMQGSTIEGGQKFQYNI